MTQKQVLIDTEKCIGCGICGKICVAHNLEIKNKKAITVMDRCILCGQCSAICPQKAILMVGCGSGQVEKTEEYRLNPNDVLNTIRFRRSIRNFKKTEISQNIIEQILEAGRLTHTAKNMQDVSFVVLNKEKKRIFLSSSLTGWLKPLLCDLERITPCLSHLQELCCREVKVTWIYLKVC